MQNSNSFVIPPNRVEVIAGLLCAVYVGVLIVLGVDPAFPKISPWGIEIIILFFLFRALICYELHDAYLLVRFLVIPVRRIPWKKVCYAAYIPHKARRNRLKRGACVIISTRPGKHYRVISIPPTVLRNPFTTIRIRLTYQDESCVEEIRKHVDLT